MFKNLKQRSLRENISWILLIGGAIGVYCATTLTNHSIDLLKNPDFNPECNLNPILSCVSVSNSPQAETFGFPNPFLGIIGFAAIATVGVAILAGAKLKKWFWLSLLAGLTFSLLFVHWLIYAALYSIGSLCLYCMVVWVVSIAMFWYTLLYLVDQKIIKPPKQLKSTAEFARKHHGDILIGWYLIIIALILNRFWYYWSTLI